MGSGKGGGGVNGAWEVSNPNLTLGLSGAMAQTKPKPYP